MPLGAVGIDSFSGSDAPELTALESWLEGVSTRASQVYTCSFTRPAVFAVACGVVKQQFSESRLLSATHVL